MKPNLTIRGAVPAVALALSCEAVTRPMGPGDATGGDSRGDGTEGASSISGGLFDAGDGGTDGCPGGAEPPEDHGRRWPFHRHDARRTGFTSARGNFSSPPAIRWTLGMGGLVEPSPVMMRLAGDAPGNDIVAGAYGGVYVAVDGGWPGPPVEPLWSFATGATHDAEPVEFVIGSAALGDLDGQADTVEVVVPGSEGAVHALASDGSLLWTYQTSSLQNTWSSPVIADVDGDGANEAVVMTDAIYVIDGATGEVVWKAGECVARTPSSPAVADVDRDGDLDVVGCPGFFGDGARAFDGPSGALLWSSAVAGHREATPAVADVDADGAFEVVEGVNGLGIAVLDAANGNVEWTAAFDWPDGCPTSSMRVMSSPAVGQLDDDPAFEIVAGSNDSCVVNEPSGVYAFDGATGQREWTFRATHGYVESSPMIGDVDPSRPGHEILFGDHGSYLILLDREGTLVWEVQLPSADCGECKIVASPALVDTDGAPGAEIVVGTNAGALVLLEAPPLDADEPPPAPDDCSEPVP